MELFQNDFNGDYINEISRLAEHLSENQFQIPFSFAKGLIDNGLVDSFTQNTDFEYFKGELTDIAKTMYYPLVAEFYRFAYGIGCFSAKKVVDKDGNETTLAKKACDYLRSSRNRDFPLNYYEGNGKFDWFATRTYYSRHLKGIPYGHEPNPEFLDFLFMQSEDGRYLNAELIQQKRIKTNSPSKSKMLLDYILINFGLFKTCKSSQDSNPWEKALDFFELMLSKKIMNLSELDTDGIQIIEKLKKYNISKEDAEQVVKSLKTAKENNVPEHILGKPLTGPKSILEDIEYMKRKIERGLAYSGELVDGYFNKHFTYEWLSKSNIEGAVLGKLCGFKAAISSKKDDGKILRAGFESPDVQNLVLRNAAGQIIAAAPMYVNQQYGYAVINGFQVGQKYRVGKNRGFEERTTLEQRQLIFDSFMDGLNKFIEEYDRQHPKKPIRFVSVGYKRNKLKDQIEKLEKATKNFRTVPEELGFLDCEPLAEQRYLYVREDDKTFDERDIVL